MKTYDNIFCIGRSILPSDNNNCTIACTGAINYGGSNLQSIRIDTFGDTLWTKSYGNAPIYKIYSAIKTPDNGSMICCRTTDGDELLIVKIDENDDSLWASSYGNGLKYPRSICSTSDSGAVITGFDENDDTFLLKLNSQGDSLWMKTYNLGSISAGRRVNNTSDGGFIIGVIKEYSEGMFNICLIKTNNLGDTLWTKTYANPEASQDVKSVCQTQNDGYFLLVATDPYSPNILAIQTDAVGDTLWTRLIGEGTGVGNPHKGICVSNGGYLITAGKRIDTQTSNIFLIRLNSSGETEWIREYGDRENYGFSTDDIIETSDYGFIMTGAYSYNDGMDGTWNPPKLLIIKTDSLGQVLSSRVQEESIVSHFKLSQNYPNPFNPITTIEYAVRDDSNVKLSVYDISGHLVETLVDEYHQAGAYNVKWNASKYSSGIYIYRLESSHGIHSRKMVLIK